MEKYEDLGRLCSSLRSLYAAIIQPAPGPVFADQYLQSRRHCAKRSGRYRVHYRPPRFRNASLSKLEYGGGAVVARQSLAARQSAAPARQSWIHLREHPESEL